MTKKRVLVIDDEPGFTKLLMLALSQYEMRAENDPRRALQAAREFLPDLILLDVIMPGTDGGDVASALRGDPALNSVPIIFLTAIVSEREVAAKGTIGGYPFVAKPVDPARLASIIEQSFR